MNVREEILLQLRPLHLTIGLNSMSPIQGRGCFRKTNLALQAR